MKILILTPPMGATGGIQRYTTTLVRSLRDIVGEENVRMLAVSAEPESRSDGTVALRRSVKIRFLSSAIAAGVSWHPQLVVCAHVGVAPAGRLIHRLTGAPYWVVLYGIDVWGELSPAKIRALQKAQRLVAISRFTMESSSARHTLGEYKVSFLAPAYAGIPAETNTAQVKTEPYTPTVLTVGRLAASERYKGHDVMLDAWPAVLQKVPNAQYVIVGDGDDRARLETRARDLNLNESVRFKGGVSAGELQACYDSCSVFALPARTVLEGPVPQGEGFGIVFLEAMAHGKAVLGPNVGAPVEFIHSGEHGLLVDPGKPEAVAGALIELLQNPERAHQMGLAAREWVLREFSYEMFCARLREILEKDSLIQKTGA